MQVTLIPVVVLFGVSAVLGIEQASLGLGLVRLQRSIHDAVGHVDSLPPLRRKRGASCLEKCLTPLASQMEGLDTTSGSLNPNIFYNTRTLNTFCSTIATAKTCFNGCGSNTVIDILKIAMGTFDGICFDNREEFESYIPCYKRSQAGISSTCDERCGGAEALEALQARQKVATASRNLRELKNIMGEMCSQVSCQKTCEGEVITETCEDDGEEAADLLKEFGISQFQQLKDKFDSMPTLAQYWPQECTDVIEEFTVEEEEEDNEITEE